MIPKKFIKGCQPFQSAEWPAVVPNYLVWLSTDPAVLDVEAQSLIDH